MNQKTGQLALSGLLLDGPYRTLGKYEWRLAHQ